MPNWDVGKKIDDLWAKLPGFVRKHKTIRTTIKHESDESYPVEPWTDQSIHKANLITSQDASLTDYGIAYHRPLLDLDFPAALIPSSTEGHYHLYIDKVMTWNNYQKLLRVMVEVGLLQQGFVDCAIERGATSLRLPWIKKDDWYANQGDPDLNLKQIQEKIIRLEKELNTARAELDRAVPF